MRLRDGRGDVRGNCACASGVRDRISSRGEGVGLSAKSLCVIGLKFVVFAFIALLVVTPRLGAATPNLVAAYGFDEGSGVSVADASGNGLTGTVANGSWSAAGKFGKALSFNGTSSRVTVPDAAALDLTTGMTLEAWVNPAVAPDGLERHHLQGQRQLLPGGVVERRQQAGRGRHHRRQPVAGVRHRPARRQHLGASGRDV